MQHLQDFAEQVDKMPLHILMQMIRSSATGRRRATKAGAVHQHNPAGTKLANQAKARLLTRSNRGPSL